MQTQRKPLPDLLLFPALHLIFLLLTIFAIVYARERIYMDAGYYLFQVVNTEMFRVEHQRYVLIFSQVLPWIGVKLNSSMPSIFLLYSLNHVLWFYGNFLLAAYWLRDRAAALSMALISFVGILFMFYGPMYEVWYGGTFVVLAYALIRSGKYKSWPGLLLTAFVIISALFAHPLLFMPLGLVLGWAWLERKPGDVKYFVLWVSLFVIWYIVKKLMLTEYEGSKMSFHLDPAHNDAFKNLFHPDYLLKQGTFLARHFWDAMILLMLGLFAFWRSGRGFMAWILLGVALFILALINLTHSIDILLTYVERLYAPLMPVAAMGFAYGMMPYLKGRSRHLLWAVPLLLFGIRAVEVLKLGEEFTARKEQYLGWIREGRSHGNTKLWIEEPKKAQPYSRIEWSLPLETLLLSGLEGPDSCVSIITHDDYTFEQNEAKLQPDQYIFRRWELEPLSSLNQKYFRLKEGKYVELK